MNVHSKDKIVLVGANGQVGAELAFYLQETEGIDLVCLVRSEYSAVLLRTMGVDVRVVQDFTQAAELSPHLADANLVVDCTYPSGQLPEIGGRIRSTVSALASSMTTGSRLAYMSSIMAWGMDGDSLYVVNRLVPRSSYAAIKRDAERTVRQTCHSKGLLAYNLRLGQVHGVLQSVTAGLRSSMEWTTLRVRGQEEDLTNTIFVSALARALVKIAKGEVGPGTYTLVSQPQWTLRQLMDFYQKRYDLSARVIYARNRKLSLLGAIKSKMMRVAVASRGMAEGLVLMRSPRLFSFLKGRYRIGAISEEFHLGGQLTESKHLLGKIPGSAISGIDSDPEVVLQDEARLERQLQTSIAARLV